MHVYPCLARGPRSALEAVALATVALALVALPGCGARTSLGGDLDAPARTDGATDGDAARPDAADALDAPPDDGPPACPPPMQPCGAACVDVRSDPAHCGGCFVQCGPGRVCVDRACRGPMECPVGQSFCFDRCVDLQREVENCGMCGRRCPPGDTCVSGTCSSEVCPPGQTRCGRACVDTRADPEHCGGCNTRCPFNAPVCAAGACTCAPGFVRCAGLCVDPRSDARHCGGCNSPCAPGASCRMGACVLPPCPAGQERCAGVCTDTRSNAAHCGACGVMCRPGTTCTAGMCGVPPCPAGQTRCGGVCTDTQSDPVNCGECANACGPATRCVRGGCVPVAARPDVLWARRAGSGAADRALGVATDAAGNVYVIGTFQSTIDFGGTVHRSNGGTDVFVASFTRAGAFRWSRSFGGTSLEQGAALAVDPTGAVVATGTFVGVVDFGSGPFMGDATSDVFVVALETSSGATRWARSFGGVGLDNATDVAAWAPGSVVVVGNFEGTLRAGPRTLVSQGNLDGFVLALDAMGNTAWAAAASGTQLDAIGGVGTTSTGEVLVAGQYRSSTNVAGVALTSAGGIDGFVASYTRDGSGLAAIGLGGPGLDVASDIDVDGARNVVVAGLFSDTATIFGRSAVSAGSTDVFVASLAPTSRDARWLRTFGAAGEDGARRLDVAPGGAIAVAGWYQRAVDFGDGALPLDPASYNAFVASLDAAGATRWSRAFGGPAEDRAFSVATAPDGSTLVAGEFQGAVNFGTGVLTSAGGADAFIVQIAP